MQKMKKRKIATCFGNDTEGKGKGKLVFLITVPAYDIDRDPIVSFLIFIL